MYPPTRYLRWARKYFGRVPFDLATSGMKPVPADELGLPEKLDDPRGWEKFRAEVARFNEVPADEAIAALGTSHALWLAYATLLGPGDDVLVEAPAYEPLLRAAEGIGARVVRFDRGPKRGWAIDPREVARAFTPKTRVVAVTNLHNPSGARASDEVLRELARFAESRGAMLLVDEVYAPFDDLGATFAGSARKLATNVVAVGSLTKCYGLGNERFGWMLAPADVIERAEDALTASCGHLPLSHANLAVHAFSKLDAIGARAKKLLEGKRAKVAAWVASRPDLAWSAPEAGLFGFAISNAAGDLLATIESAAEKDGVLVAPGAFFGVPNGFRLAWSIDDAKLDEALTRLAAVLPRGAT